MICTLLAPLALAACAEAAGPAHTPVTTRLAMWTQIERVRFRPERVVEDSRCPMNVRCARAGRAIVRISVRDGGSARQVDVMLGGSVPVAGGRLALVAVKPERVAGTQPKPQAPYQFVFELRDKGR